MMLIRFFCVLVVTVFVTVPTFSEDFGAEADPSSELTGNASQLSPVTVAMFSSKFCSACLVLEPKLRAVETALQATPANFVIFDQTTSLFTRGRLQRQADEQKIRDIYERFRGKTGFALIIDPEKGEILETITMRDSEPRIAAKITAAMRSKGEEQVPASVAA